VSRTDRFAVCIVDSGGLKEVQVQSYLPGGTNVPTWEGTLTPPGEYDRWRQCGLMSNYFDHLFGIAIEIVTRLCKSVVMAAESVLIEYVRKECV